jgi:hypothetical protein
MRRSLIPLMLVVGLLAETGSLAAGRDGINWRRVALLTVTGVFLVGAAWEVPIMLGLINTPPDADFYREAGQRWLSTGSFYLPGQLTGPYTIVLNRDVLYPPIALILFVPFALGLPAPLFWAIPLGVAAYAGWRWRPAMWTWPLLAAILFWKQTLAVLLLGNSDLWIATAIAGGLLWGWPAVFVVLKPPFGLLALVGVRHRSWWIAAALMGALSLAMLPLWLDYLATLHNSGVPWLYSLGGIPIALAPLIAWAGRTPLRNPGPIGHDLDSARPHVAAAT